MSGLSVVAGDVIAGKYRVEGVLGRGAMGMVVSATHLGLGSRVAIKLLHREMLRSPEAVTRFAREARAAAALASDHVTRVLDVGSTESGVPYMVMEHLAGETLDAVVNKEGPLAIADAITFALHVCDALSEAHAVGITHRDLKPANIFVVRKANGQRIAKVLDFGISKIDNASIAGDSKEITLTGALVGTPSFMAPEQLRMNGPVGPLTDVWAFAASFYYALTKHLPYQTETFYELNIKMEQAEPTPITAWRNDLPPALVDVFDGCLRREPSIRWSLGTIASRLEDARAEIKASQSDIVAPVATDAVAAPSSRKKIFVVGIAGLCAIAVPIAVWAARKPTVEIPPVSAESSPSAPRTGDSVGTNGPPPPQLDGDAGALLVASPLEAGVTFPNEVLDAGRTVTPTRDTSRDTVRDQRPPRPLTKTPSGPAPKPDSKRNGALTHER